MRKVIGGRIKEWRKSKKLKLWQVIEIFRKKGYRISQGSLSDIENGKSDPSANTIQGFYVCTDISIGWMLTGNKGKAEKGAISEKDPPMIITLPKNIKEVLIRKE